MMVIPSVAALASSFASSSKSASRPRSLESVVMRTVSKGVPAVRSIIVALRSRTARNHARLYLK
jgi:hypothetical protein